MMMVHFHLQPFTTILTHLSRYSGCGSSYCYFVFVLFVILPSSSPVLSARPPRVATSTSNEILASTSRNSSQVLCQVPKYQPYFWVKDVSSTEIIMGVTDPNKLRTVTGYTVYFWGHKFGVESTIEPGTRDYGQRNLPREGPYVIAGLKPGFVYCADITAVNNCGHGPFCIACFENIATLEK